MARNSNVGKKVLVGHHLMRVRIRNSIFVALQEAADQETILVGEPVSVSDLVRVACVNYLLVRDSLMRLRGVQWESEEEEDWGDGGEDDEDWDDDEEEEIIFHFE